MDNVRDEWNAIAARTQGLLSSVSLWASLPSAVAMQEQSKHLLRESERLVNGVDQFLVDRGSFMPATMKLTVEADTRLRALVSDKTINSSRRDGVVAEVALRLSSMLNEVAFHLHGKEEALRSRSERAFEHLRWSIMADKDIRARWKQAFDEGETSCEALGATHLLLHGVYAFKAHSPKARTDLVFKDVVETARAGLAEGLVLTEWKKAKSPSDAASKSAAAEAQSDAYSAGVLGGVELRSVRYIVILSQKQLAMPADTSRVDFVYRHINIPVDPDSPSAAATKKS